MKTKKLSLALMSLVLGFASCSEEIDVIETNNDKDYESTTFASLTINLSTDTKAVPGEFGDGTVAAEEGEQLISELYLFSFKNEEGDESLLFSKRFGSIIVNSAQLTGETGPFAIPVGSQKLYLVANPSATITNIFNTKLNYTKTEFENEIFSEVETSSGKFMMTSCDGPKVIDPQKGNTVEIDVNLSRVLAKITYEPKYTDNKYNFSSSNIQLQGVKIINKHKSEYVLRRVGLTADDLTIGGKENLSAGLASNYVVDPDFFKKTPVYSNSPIKNNKSLYYVSDLTYQAISTTGEAKLGYCMENTMQKDAQINTYTTGVVFSAKCNIADLDFTVTPEAGDEYSTDGTFYRTSDGRLYPSLKAILSIYDPSAVSVTDYKYALENLNILYEVFDKGICYYPLWLRHSDNSDDKEMGIMEFGIVRNNIYKIKVNTISAIGKSSDKDIDDSEDPDEDPKVYLDASVYICPWILRNNEVDL